MPSFFPPLCIFNVCLGVPRATPCSSASRAGRGRLVLQSCRGNLVHLCKMVFSSSKALR